MKTKETFKNAIQRVFLLWVGKKFLDPEKFRGWRVHTMASYLLLMSFLIHEIQVLQLHWKKCVDHNDNYVEKWISFDHIPREYLGQFLNFSANPWKCDFMLKTYLEISSPFFCWFSMGQNQFLILILKTKLRSSLSVCSNTYEQYCVYIRKILVVYLMWLRFILWHLFSIFSYLSYL